MSTPLMRMGGPGANVRVRPVGVLACALALCALLACAQPPGAEAACNRYAATSGSDSAPGTAAAPYKTLIRLIRSLSAGQTGCLQSGQTFDTAGNLAVGSSDVHGTGAAPVTITSTNPANPATITHSFATEAGANYLVVKGLRFDWTLPRPWVCWNAEGNPINTEVITGPNTCGSGTPNPEDVIQIGLSGKGDALIGDEVTSNNTNICVIIGRSGEGDVVEHSRIHGCGPTVRSSAEGFPVLNQEWGWHTQGIYVTGRGAVIRNNYIYEAARDGVLLYGGGERAVVEHNVLDANGAGVWFGDNTNNLVKRNIVTNSGSPRGAVDFGLGAFQPGSGNVAEENCLYGNTGGDVSLGGVSAKANLLNTDPLYLNGAAHDYRLSESSPCLGYGPDTAQPGAQSEPESPGEAPFVLPPATTAATVPALSLAAAASPLPLVVGSRLQPLTHGLSWVRHHRRAHRTRRARRASRAHAALRHRR